MFIVKKLEETDKNMNPPGCSLEGLMLKLKLQLWPTHAKSWLTGEDPDARRDWGQEEKGTREDEMAGWHHWLDGHESEWTPGVGDGQRGLACWFMGLQRVGHDWVTELNWTLWKLKGTRWFNPTDVGNSSKEGRGYTKTGLNLGTCLGLPDPENAFQLYVHERERIALGMLTQRLGSEPQPVAYLSKRLDLTAWGWPPHLPSRPLPPTFEILQLLQSW